ETLDLIRCAVCIRVGSKCRWRREFEGGECRCRGNTITSGCCGMAMRRALSVEGDQSAVEAQMEKPIGGARLLADYHASAGGVVGIDLLIRVLCSALHIGGR